MSEHWNRFGSSVMLAALLVCGCTEIRTDYGTSKGSAARRSVNGFAALRESYRNAGFRNRDVSRLSDRVLRTDVIVWTPQMLGSVDSRVTRWMEKWLARGDRTLIYIVPDSGSEADYWRDAIAIAPAEQRMEYRRRAAKSINERMVWRLNRRDIASNGWFQLRPLKHRVELDELAGPWRNQVGNPDQVSSNDEVSGDGEVSGDDEVSGDGKVSFDGDPPGEMGVEFLIAAYQEPKAKSAGAAAPPAAIRGPTGPGAPSWPLPTETVPTSTKLEFTPLIEMEAGQCVIGKVTSKRWKDSKILVVAGGSLLTNYALTRPWNRRLAETILDASTPQTEGEHLAGFLSSNWMPIPVSERKPSVPHATGMELLTVWPISLVTMHGVMLGLVICLALLPIFGRPKRITREAQNDFGHHLDAVAALMNKAGGEDYARSRISEYMKRMHGETSGPWILQDTETTPQPLVGEENHPRPSSSETREPMSATETVAKPDHAEPESISEKADR